jgi:hypothetical protein
MDDLQYFISTAQLLAICENAKGEEGQFFRDLLRDLEARIKSMPGPYETEAQGSQASAALHYFNGSSDWYIFERDGDGPQLQNFGFACLNGDVHNAELGYISIQELIQNGVELDLFYKPETLAMIRDRHKAC